VVAVPWIGAGLVDRNRFVETLRIKAQGGLHRQLTTDRETEAERILDSACRPSVLRHSRDGGKSHPGKIAKDVQQGRQGINLLNGGDVPGYLFGGIARDGPERLGNAFNQFRNPEWVWCNYASAHSGFVRQVDYSGRGPKNVKRVYEMADR